MSNINITLAMYDVRGKQDFIFRSKKIKEIVGGSAIIRDVYKDYLLPAAEEVGKANNKEGLKYADDFSENNIEELFKKYIGIVVNEGGGNFHALYPNIDICKEINKKFTYSLLKTIPTLKVLCSFIDNVNLNDYVGDEERLRKAHSINESKNQQNIYSQVLPITKIDKSTSYPIEKIEEPSFKTKEKYSRETYYKLKKYKSLSNELKDNVNVLDDIVDKNDSKSLLAIVYIDGNNMGSKFANESQKQVDKSYQTNIKALKELSSRIQKDMIDDRMHEINNISGLSGAIRLDDIDDNKNETENIIKKRYVVFAGDEINLICNAKDAFKIVETYFDGLKKVNMNLNDEGKLSSCAGICIFHAHDPYYLAYKYAEECCENGKKKMKYINVNEGFFVDWQLCSGAFSVDLDTARENNDERNGTNTRPWLYDTVGNVNIDNNVFSVKQVKGIVKEFNSKNVARSNIKAFPSYIAEGLAKYNIEIERINAHQRNGQKIDLGLNGSLNFDKQMRLINDVVKVYDIWFRKIFRERGH